MGMILRRDCYTTLFTNWLVFLGWAWNESNVSTTREECIKNIAADEFFMSLLDSIFYSEQFISSISKCEHLLHRFFLRPRNQHWMACSQKIVIKLFSCLSRLAWSVARSAPPPKFYFSYIPPHHNFLSLCDFSHFHFGLSHFHLHTLTFKKVRPFSRNILSLSPNYLGGLFARCVGVMM